jgi:hypothetical protein
MENPSALEVYMRAKIISSLEKCFPDETVPDKEALDSIILLQNERFSFQVCYDCEELVDDKQIVHFTVESPLAEYIRIYMVKYIPSTLPVYRKRHDEHYLRTQPGLFPDLLEPMETGYRLPASNILNSLWLEVDPQGNVVAAKVLDEVSSGDPCLRSFAVRAARLSKFSASTSAPARQNGDILYRFIAQ